MTLIHQDSGCKVGWEYWSTETEALAASARAAAERERKFALGYDFGFQWPGSVEHFADHPRFGECWKVTTP